MQSWNNTGNGVIAAGSKVAEVEYAMSNHTATFTVGNTPGITLPATGGSGTTLFYALGSALLLLAALGFVLRGRRRDW